MGYSKNTVKIAKNYLDYQMQVNNHEQNKRYIKAITNALEKTIETARPNKAKKIRHALEDKIFNGVKANKINEISQDTLNRYSTRFYEILEEELKLN